MKFIYFFVFVFFITIFSCKSTKYTEYQINFFEILVENKSLRIESDTAYPQVTNAMQQVLNSGILSAGNNASSISLIGNSNFLRISGDSITSYLPYFGERQMNIDFGGTNGGIQLQGIMENYTVTKGINNSVILSFKAKSKQESYNIQIKLYPNLNAVIHLNGNSRSPISYSGRVEVLNE